MRSVEFYPAAQDEFISAAQFYESHTAGLGLDFILTVQRTYERLLEWRFQQYGYDRLYDGRRSKFGRGPADPAAAGTGLVSPLSRVTP